MAACAGAQGDAGDAAGGGGTTGSGSTGGGGLWTGGSGGGANEAGDTSGTAGPVATGGSAGNAGTGGMQTGGTSAGTGGAAGETGETGGAGGVIEGGAGGSSGDGGDDGVPSPVLEAIPVPCIGAPYAHALSTHGGVPPYSYELLSGEGLSLDPDSNTLSGTIRNAGPITIEVKDANAKTARHSVNPRERCWFAYVAEETGIPALALYDPVLETKLPSTGDPALGDNVTDFAFSPDGRYLAYRRAVLGEPVRLELFEPLTGSSESYLFSGESSEGSVTHYEWSPDSSMLAVAFEADDGVWLSGLRREGDGPELVTEGAIQSDIDGIIQLARVRPCDPAPP